MPQARAAQRRLGEIAVIALLISCCGGEPGLGPSPVPPPAPPPLPQRTVTVNVPAGVVDVTPVVGKTGSVSFRIAGSTNVDRTEHKVCPLIYSEAGAEWHVQNEAMLGVSGNWALDKAYIGDESAPVLANSRLRVAAVAVPTATTCTQDRKIRNFTELTPVAESSVVEVTVRIVP